MSRTKRSRTRSTPRKRAPRIASRAVTAPTPPIPTAPPLGSPETAPPTSDRTLPHGPPGRPTHLRISETNPWSVTLMSFFFLTGLGVCVLGTALVTSLMLQVVAPGQWPTPWETMVTAIGVVTLEIVLGTALGCLCSFMYNYTARFSGGVEVALTDDLTDPTPAAEALQLMTRLHALARRRLDVFLPVNSRVRERFSRRRHGDSPPLSAEAEDRPQRRQSRT
ncbi:DUF3566 domain-containing protein [Streptomyces sp. NPDC007901]|uniref:DUF3566 domain-containing protein n=1 Tax=Streptomyces sp. NPDC007901 TaxID=3364785 RepID=UPI0036EABC83